MEYHTAMMSTTCLAEVRMLSSARFNKTERASANHSHTAESRVIVLIKRLSLLHRFDRTVGSGLISREHVSGLRYEKDLTGTRGAARSGAAHPVCCSRVI